VDSLPGVRVDYHLDEWERRVFAHTSPVYVACGGALDDDRPRRHPLYPDARRGCPRIRTAHRGPEVRPLTTHHHGEADHLAWLERPFAEALRALESAAGSDDEAPLVRSLGVDRLLQGAKVLGNCFRLRRVGDQPDVSVRADEDQGVGAVCVGHVSVAGEEAAGIRSTAVWNQRH
jgi:hypothetical protein